jgi:hypothetical protein
MNGPMGTLTIPGGEVSPLMKQASISSIPLIRRIVAMS